MARRRVGDSKEEALDLSGDGGVLKTILQEGQGVQAVNGKSVKGTV